MIELKPRFQLGADVTIKVPLENKEAGVSMDVPATFMIARISVHHPGEMWVAHQIRYGLAVGDGYNGTVFDVSEFELLQRIREANE